jgi:hypothetical protein
VDRVVLSRNRPGGVEETPFSLLPRVLCKRVIGYDPPAVRRPPTERAILNTTVSTMNITIKYCVQ